MEAICNLPVVPARAEPDDRSEMTTQLLFGETLTITEELGNWLKIKIHHDGYEGWIDRKQVQVLEDDFQQKYHARHYITERAAVCVNQDDDSRILLSKGSLLPIESGGRFHINRTTYSTTAHIRAIPKKAEPHKAAIHAKDYQNTPYLWGGRSIFGIDCSGLVQVVYSMCGINLPRDAYMQALEGEVVDFVDEAIPGDLVFFDNPAGDIIHTGIIVAPGKIIHASGKVRIDVLDHNGIFNTESGRYSHSLRVIKHFRDS
jgi:cell wall-associated NlpC family hydrolase